jgi:hypothetical protein
MNSNLTEANEVLRRGAKGMHQASILLPLMLGGMGLYRFYDSDESIRAFYAVIFAGLALLGMVMARSRYKELARLLISEDGLVLRDSSQQLMVAWKTIDKAKISTKGFRLFPRGMRPVSGNLALAGNTAPLVSLLKQKLVKP